MFLQDGWKPTDRLTLNLGVRMDHLGGGAPDQDAVYSKTMFAPRIGFAFDLTGYHTTVLKGSYSQYYEGIFNDVYKAATTGYADRISWDMAGCPAYGPQGPTADYRCPLSARDEVNRVEQPVGRIDPDIKHPRVDEWSLGIERQFGQNWRFSATGVYRENKNFIGSVLPDARWTPTSVTSTASPTVDGCDDCSALPATTVTAYRWANRATSTGNLLITNPDGFQYLDPNGNVLGTMNAYRKYKALMFTLGRRYADRWQAQVSYVYSKSEGTVNNTSDGAVRREQLLRDADARAHELGRRAHQRPAARDQGVPRLRDPEDRRLGERHVPVISGPTYTPFQRFSSSRSTGRRPPTTSASAGRSAEPGAARQPPPADGERCSTCGSRRCSTSPAATASRCSPTS